MKKILAIILVVAMVLVPVSALAANESIVTVTNVTVTETGAKGGKIVWYNAAGVKQDFIGQATPTNVQWYADITAPAGFLVDSVNWNGVAVNPATTPDAVKGYYGPITCTAATATLDITYKANLYSVSGVIVGGDDSSLNVLSAGFGSVAGASTAKKGSLTLTASVKNAYFSGTWFVGTTDDGETYTWDKIVNAGKVVSTECATAATGYSVTIDLSKVGQDFNGPAYIGAKVDQVSAVIVADVAYYCKGMGTVSVNWLSATSVKVTAAAAKGCKFVSWKYNLNPELLVKAGIVAAAADAEWASSPVLYLTSIDQINTQATFEAYFIRTSGDFTTGTEDATGGKSDNPKTGDASNIALWTIVGIIALGGVALASKKVFSK